MTDLWPENIGKVREKSPVAVLRKQASLLGRKTKNLIQSTRQNPDLVIRAEPEREVLCADIEQELHDNDVDLEVSLEMVGGSGKKSKILKLTDYLDRRGYLNYLIDAVRETRPEII
ncbi:hypothetical protein QUF72_15365 [Desulfobacterales bacterium HSG2]|nr:hypothetical protein [Desulfobacterales bacterium HSG2]